MRYGIGYLGSKNDIAERLIAVLPPAETFVDLFAGGCAMTHCAMLSGKYKRFIINDISDAPTLFLDAIAGKYANETRWISREDFFRLKDSDPYVKYGWSFGNNGNDYIYGRHIEAYKKAYHYAVFFNDFSLFEAIGIIIPEHTKALMDAMPNNTERRLVLRRYIVKHKSLIKAALKEHALKENRPADLQSLERL
ncbi:MAG: DNA adenine methylase, partial [Prevotella sp.]|nr:DNA adenine methylase [Prevotella sp.]